MYMNISLCFQLNNVRYFVQIETVPLESEAESFEIDKKTDGYIWDPKVPDAV